MKRSSRHFAILFSCLMAIFFILNSSPVLAARVDVEAFVTRFYQQCLNREPEQAGLDNWVDALLDGSLYGADVANGFVFSQEFINRNTTNEDFVTILYRAFFDREPDDVGYSNWLNYLYDGNTRSAVLNGFVSSQEFYNLCARFGITAEAPDSGDDSGDDSGATVSTDATANTNLITSFTGSNSSTVSGTWTNETFGSTGDVSVNFSFNAATNVITIIWDINGNVYGGSDPDPETFTIDMANFISNGTATLAATSTTYGDISVTLTYNTDGTGTFTGTVVNEPTGAVTNASFSGTFVLVSGTVTFTVENSTFVYFGTTVTCSNNVSSTLN